MFSSTFFIGLFVAIFLIQSIFSILVELLNRRHMRKFGSETPEVFKDYIDDSQLKRIYSYYMDNSVFGIISKILQDSVLLIFILAGGFNWINGLGIISSNALVTGGLEFFILLLVLGFFFGLPFDYYHTFIIEQKHGFNNSTKRLWASDQLKGLMVSAVLMVIILAPLLLAIKHLPNSWWFWGFVIIAVIELSIAELYPVLIAPLFNKFEPLSDKDLAEKVKYLVESAGLKAEGVFQMDAGKRSKHTNAYFTGLGKTKRIALFDTLLESHSHKEILAVLAHEIGHYKLRHIPKSLILSMASSLVIFYLTFRIVQAPAFQQAFEFDNNSLYIGLLVIGIFWRRASYFLKPIPMALSRYFERQADQYALNLIGEAEPMIEALKRLAKDNLSNLNPHPFTVWFNYSHPPLDQRILALQSQAEAQGF